MEQVSYLSHKCNCEIYYTLWQYEYCISTMQLAQFHQDKCSILQE